MKRNSHFLSAIELLFQLVEYNKRLLVRFRIIIVRCLASLVSFTMTKEARGSRIEKSSHSDTSDSCYSLRKIGDYWWECPISEEEGMRHDEQITYDVIVLDHIDVDGILTR